MNYVGFQELKKPNLGINISAQNKAIHLKKQKRISRLENFAKLVYIALGVLFQTQRQFSNMHKFDIKLVNV